MSNMLESLQLNIAFFPVITTITQRNIRTISNYLCRAGIVFEVFHHEPVLTCEEGKNCSERRSALLQISASQKQEAIFSFCHSS